MDNRFRVQQAEGQTRKSHNVLSGHDIRGLFSSSELNGTTTRLFQCRLIFGIAICTLMRPKELSLLEVGQFTKKNSMGTTYTW